MSQRKIDPKEQFSKKLAGRVEWFWMFFMTACVVGIILQPEGFMGFVWLALMVTIVMALAYLAYTRNSIDEKWFFWLNEIAKSVSAWKKKGENDEEDSVNEGGNG